MTSVAKRRRLAADVNRDHLHDLSALKLSEEFTSARERSSSVTQYALQALRGLTLINGGAIVAAFTLLSNQKIDQSSITQPTLWIGFGLFAIGLFAAVASSVAAYFAESDRSTAELAAPSNTYLALIGQPQQNAGETYSRYMARYGKWRVGAIVMGVLSLASFIAGSGTCLESAWHLNESVTDAVASPPPVSINMRFYSAPAHGAPNADAR